MQYPGPQYIDTDWNTADCLLTKANLGGDEDEPLHLVKVQYMDPKTGFPRTAIAMLYGFQETESKDSRFKQYTFTGEVLLPKGHSKLQMGAVWLDDKQHLDARVLQQAGFQIVKNVLLKEE